MKRWELSRRTLLRGIGASLALPLLEQMLPGAGRAEAAGHASIRRLVALFAPCGMIMERFTPAETGSDYALTPILKPLEPVKDDVLVVTGLANRPAYPDGPGPHVGGTGSFLTARKILPNGRIGNGVSMDQIAARVLGKHTRYPSLELGIDGTATGACEGDFSCAYLCNIAWTSETAQLAKEVNPRALFDRLFGAAGGDPAERALRNARRRSVLDLVRGDTERLVQRLGTADRRRLDEYLTGIRELERRLDAPGPEACEAGEPPQPITDLRDHTRAMFDLIVLALRCDQTRVITFMMGNGASARQFPFLGISGQHHALSHHQNDPEKVAANEAINTWEVSQLAYFLGQMKAAKEPDGSSLLDSSLVYFGSEMGDPNVHDRLNLPVLLAGGAGGQLKTGRHVRLASEQPVAKLYVSMLGMLGAPVPSFGLDGDGPLAGL